MKIRPVGAELLLAGGRTDRHEEAVIFRYFANAPKNKDAVDCHKLSRLNLRMIHYNIKMCVCYR